MQSVKYYFISEDGCSYPIDFLVNVARIHLENPYNEPDSMLYQNIISPKGNVITYMKSKDFKTDQLEKEIINHTILDLSRSSNEENCSISLEPFKDPVLLNLTGRTYSKDTIIKAIESSIMKDDPLRLEDRTLNSEDVENIRLYPVASAKWKMNYENPENCIKFEAPVIKDFDFNAIKNIDQDAIKKAVESSDDGMWEYKKIWSLYASKFELPTEWPDRTIAVRDIKISNAEMFKSHPKCNTGHFIFKNVLIQNCKVKISCFCGVSFQSCKFLNCEIDISLERISRVKNNIFQNCTVVVAEKNFVKTDKNIKIFEVYKEFLTKATNVENCTMLIDPKKY